MDNIYKSQNGQDKYILIGRITQDFILVNKVFLSKFNNISKEGLTELYYEKNKNC